MKTSKEAKNDAQYSTALEGHAGAPEDRVLVRHRELNVNGGNTEQPFLIAVADGAGGRSGGSPAAGHVVKQFKSIDLPEEPGEFYWEQWVQQMDRQLQEDPKTGLSTILVAVVTRNRISGASAGDSELRVLTDEETQHITKHQHRKPLPGTGKARPVSFEAEHNGESILAATDGFWKYTGTDDVIEKHNEGGDVTAADFVDLVRLRSGDLRDDVGIVLIKFEERDSG